jgi:hypothetical protein
MAKLSFFDFIREQWRKVPIELVDLTGKTVVLIGANVGLGFEAAKHFASMNPKRLVLGCRNQEKGQAAVQGKLAVVDLVVFASKWVLGKPYKPLGLKMLSSHLSTSFDLRLYQHLRTLSFARTLK